MCCHPAAFITGGVKCDTQALVACLSIAAAAASQQLFGELANQVRPYGRYTRMRTTGPRSTVPYDMPASKNMNEHDVNDGANIGREKKNKKGDKKVKHVDKACFKI